MTTHFQLGIVGGGPGGYVCALRAAQLGLSVVLIEGERLGGTCLNKGCIPTKALVRSAELWREIGHAGDFGIVLQQPQLDYGTVVKRKAQVVDTLVSGVETLVKKAKIQYVNGWASVEQPGKISVQTEEGLKEFEVDNIVLATGSVPARIPIPGADLDGVLTSDEILEMSELPERLVIIGGGVIGMEFACIYQSFGVQVTVIEALPRILPNVDEEISKRLTPLLKRQGLAIHAGAKVEEIQSSSGQLTVVFNDGKSQKSVDADKVLISTGRLPNLRGIDVEKLGLKLEKRAIAINDKWETNVPGIYAIGDVTGRIMLAHVASMEGIAVAEQIAGEHGAKVNYQAVPNAIFTYPEIATVGATEQDLKAQGVNYQVSKFPFSANGKALALGDTVGLVKLIADDQGVIRGGCIMGPQASSLIQEIVVAVDQGLTGEHLAKMIHAHPTLPEAVMEAAHGLSGKPLHLA